MDISSLIQEFGKSLGIDHLALNQEGNLCLEFEEMGTLNIEHGNDQALISLSRTIPPYQKGISEKALRLCHFTHGPEIPVHPALMGEDQLFFVIKAAETELSLPFLEQSMTILNSYHRQILNE